MFLHEAWMDWLCVESMESMLFKTGASIVLLLYSCMHCEVGPRERETWGGDDLDGMINSGWKNCLIVGLELKGLGSLVVSIFSSSLFFLISFTLCNCLNLSCSKTMEERNTVGWWIFLLIMSCVVEVCGCGFKKAELWLAIGMSSEVWGGMNCFTCVLFIEWWHG